MFNKKKAVFPVTNKDLCFGEQEADKFDTKQC